jgi:hypothetical protein
MATYAVSRQQDDLTEEHDCDKYLAEDLKNLPERPIPAVHRNFKQYFALGEWCSLAVIASVVKGWAT